MKTSRKQLLEDVQTDYYELIGTDEIMLVLSEEGIKLGEEGLKKLQIKDKEKYFEDLKMLQDSMNDLLNYIRSSGDINDELRIKDIESGIEYIKELQQSETIPEILELDNNFHEKGIDWIISELDIYENLIDINVTEIIDILKELVEITDEYFQYDDSEPSDRREKRRLKKRYLDLESRVVNFINQPEVMDIYELYTVFDDLTTEWNHGAYPFDSSTSEVIECAIEDLELFLKKYSS